ncbi:MAG: tetratricopeptide repeat protein [Bacteroidales bacterium]|nr:tetratricopeptide repeat protein [Bacteroidales bacterium]
MKLNLFRYLLISGLMSLVFIGLPVLLRAGNDTESLLQELKLSKSDTSKLRILNQLSANYLTTDFGQSRKYADLALRKAILLHNNKGMALAYRNIGKVYLYTGDPARAHKTLKKSLFFAKNSLPEKQLLSWYKDLSFACYQDKMLDSAIVWSDKFLQTAKITESGREVSEAHKQIAALYTDAGLPDSSIFHLRKALELDESFLRSLENNRNRYTQVLKQIASTQSQLGSVYSTKGDFNQAIEFKLKAVAIAVIVGDKKLLPTVYDELGDVYSFSGNTEKAVDYYYKSLRIFEEQGDKHLIASSYTRLGLVYTSHGHINEAHKFFYMALNLQRNMGNKAGLAETLNNLGDMYRREEMSDSAEYYFKESLALNRLLTNTLMEGINLRNLGEVALQKGNLGSARVYLLQALSILKESQQEEYAISIHNSLGTFYTKTGNIQKAYQEYKIAYNTARRIMDASGLKDATLGLAHSLEKLGNFSESIQYYKLYTSQKDSFESVKRSRQFAEIQSTYELEKNRNENMLQNEHIKALERSKRLNQIIRWSLIIVFTLVIIIGYMSFNRLKLKIKDEKEKQEADLAIHQAQQALMAADLHNKDIETRHLEEELKFKANNLVNLALQIGQKNDFQEDIRKTLKQLKNISDTDREKGINDLLLKLAQQNRSTREHERLQLEIEKNNTDFFKKISNICPDITENEKQLSALLRINLSSKEIASLNNISIKAVEMSRYRLRKKLNLDNNDFLSDFLQKL